MEPCSVCREPTAAKCPYCKKSVCPSSYGWRKSCGIVHEETCIGAKAARDGTMKKTYNKDYDKEKATKQPLEPAREKINKKRRR